MVKNINMEIGEMRCEGRKNSSGIKGYLPDCVYWWVTRLANFPKDILS